MSSEKETAENCGSSHGSASGVCVEMLNGERYSLAALSRPLTDKFVVINHSDHDIELAGVTYRPGEIEVSSMSDDRMNRVLALVYGQTNEVYRGISCQRLPEPMYLAGCHLEQIARA